jgi:hypothetical protein
VIALPLGHWRPSGGFGIAWQPVKTLMFGFRALLNDDRERRFDPAATSEGLARSVELRIGGSVSPWEGALFDVGGTRLDKRNGIAGTLATSHEPNIGFEQVLLSRGLTVRLGVDETSPTAGLSATFAPFNIDVAYVRNMARNTAHVSRGRRRGKARRRFPETPHSSITCADVCAAPRGAIPLYFIGLRDTLYMISRSLRASIPMATRMPGRVDSGQPQSSGPCPVSSYLAALIRHTDEQCTMRPPGRR